MRILSIDIGAKNCGIAIIEVEFPNKINKLILKNISILTFELKLFFEQFNEFIDDKIDKIVVERQSNLNHKAQQIYHYLECFAFFNKILFVPHSPITRYVKIQDSNRVKRKKFSLDLSNDILKNIKMKEITSHDVADALNIGLFYIMKTQNKKLCIEDLKTYYSL